MKNILKQERGVSLISLATAVIILGVIVTLLLYNVKDTKDISNLTNLYSDIDNLTDKVSNYYSTYGEIPALEKSGIDTTQLPIGANDNENFLVLDLSAIENLTLNYGQDYEKVKSDSVTDIGSNTDLYIINEKSHNIYYLKGIKVEDKYYYTNRDTDTEAVNIKYVAGIKIPEGCTYKSGNSKNNLKVQNSSNVEYTWANTADNEFTFTKTGNDYYLIDKENQNFKIVLTTEQNADDLVASEKEFGGLFYTAGSEESTISVIYISIAEDDNWGPVYDSAGVYTDTNEDKAYIPAGFKVSKLSTLNTIKKGLVIKNDTTQDEYVWIDVPDNVLKDKNELGDIEKALKDYTTDYREDGYEDTYKGDFINLTNGDATANSEAIYNDLKNKMLQSIKEYGGFYIGRYEAGKSSDNKAISQKDKIPWNSITVSDAQIASNSLSTDSYTTSLMFGIQWDLVCKFIEETGEKTRNEIAQESSTWGNYKNAQFIITSDKAQKLDTSWTAIVKGTTKSSGSTVLLTTAACDQNKALNLYDFNGNDWEWTLQNALNESDNKYVARGGNYSRTSGSNEDATKGTAACRYINSSTFGDVGVGFRVTLFQNPTQNNN